MSDTPDLPPSRRSFLRLGAAGAAAAVLVACSDDESSPPSETGVTEPEPTETTFAPPQTTTPEAGEIADATVTRTARTVELAMVVVYGAFLGTGTGEGGIVLQAPIDYDDDTRAALQLMRDRHEAHADALTSLVSDAGGDPVSEPNNGVLGGVVSPQLADLTTQRSVLLLARTLEDVAAGTYGWGAGQVTTPALREGLMAVGAVTARHSAAISVLIDPSGASAVTTPVLDTSGPARLPDYMLVTPELADGGDALAEADTAGGDTPAEGEEADDATEGESDTDAETTVPE